MKYLGVVFAFLVAGCSGSEGESTTPIQADDAVNLSGSYRFQVQDYTMTCGGNSGSNVAGYENYFYLDNPQGETLVVSRNTVTAPQINSDVFSYLRDNGEYLFAIESGDFLFSYSGTLSHPLSTGQLSVVDFSGEATCSGTAQTFVTWTGA